MAARETLFDVQASDAIIRSRSHLGSIRTPSPRRGIRLTSCC